MQSDERRFDIQQIGDVGVVKFFDSDLCGNDTNEVIKKELFALAEKGGWSKLVLDCSNVEHFSSVTLSTLFGVKKRLEVVNGKLRLCKLAENLREVLCVVGWFQLFRIEDSLEAALQSCQNGYVKSGCFDIEESADVTVLTFRDGNHVDYRLGYIMDDLRSLVEEDGRNKLVLDFSNVADVSKHLSSMLWTLHAKLNAASGKLRKLRLCNLGKNLRDRFLLNDWSQHFCIEDSLEAALQSFQDGPELPLIASQPLPDAEMPDAVGRILAEWESAHS